MTKQTNYKLKDIEEIISEMDTVDNAYVNITINDTMQLIVDTLCVNIPELNIDLREAEIYIWDNDTHEYELDFNITVLYKANSPIDEWLYYEQDGFVVTLANWLQGELTLTTIEQLNCNICKEI